MENITREKNHYIQRTMPNSPDAEKACLAVMMMDANLCLDLCAMLDESSFYTPKHRTIFNAIRDITDKKSPADLVAVSTSLAKSGAIAEIGGVEALIEISEFIPSTANYLYYARAVQQSEKLREIIDCCNQVISYCYETTDSAEKAIAFAQSKILDIKEGKSGNSLVHASTYLAEVIAKLETAYRNKGAVKGICTHFNNIDDVTNGFLPGQMIVIAARPGVGKTSFVLNIVDNIAVHEQKKRTVALFNLEMSGTELVTRMVMNLGNLDMGRMLTGQEDMEDLKKVFATNITINNANIFIDDTGTITPEEIAARCRRLKQKEGLDLIVIDYLQLLKCSRDFRGNKQSEVEELSRQIKLMAKDLRVPIIVLSQMSRDIEKREMAAGKKGESEDNTPVLADLRGSGAIEQDADIVAFLDSDKSQQWGDEQYIRFIIAKHRSGPCKTLHFAFIKNKMMFKPCKEKFFPKKEGESSSLEEMQNEDDIRGLEGDEIEIPNEEPDIPEADLKAYERISNDINNSDVFAELDDEVPNIEPPKEIE